MNKSYKRLPRQTNMPRSKNYLKSKELVEKDKLYSIEEAIELVKKTSTVKFDASVEMHLKLGIDPKHSDQQLRTTTVLPHGTGKTLKVAVFAEDENQKKAKASGADIVGSDELIEKIKKTGKIEFDVAVATPDMMKKMGMIAKILGPKGLMPSPKNDTITPDVAKAVENLKKGKVTIKNDENGNVHQIIGKTSFDDAKLVENSKSFLEAIKNAKPSGAKGTYIEKIVLTSSMGPAIPLKIS